jgi:hypothetical protein
VIGFNPTKSFSKNNHRVTALVVGAGAVENAWTPVIRAIQPYYEFPLTPDSANCVLARLVYLLRWYSAVDSEVAKRELPGLTQMRSDIRRAICAELRKSELAKEITVRKEFERIVQRFLIQDNRRLVLMLITTNWDTVIATALSQILNKTMVGTIRPLHIHGSIAHEETLYLPTEMTKEPYRTPEEEQHIGGLHGSTWRGLEGAHRVIVYGLSLSPLDAELGQTLAAGWSNKNLEEISVVCPDHEVVSHRVNLLLDPRRDVIVKGYEPQPLEKAVDYSVRRGS